MQKIPYISDQVLGLICDLEDCSVIERLQDADRYEHLAVQIREILIDPFEVFRSIKLRLWAWTAVRVNPATKTEKKDLLKQ